MKKHIISAGIAGILIILGILLFPMKWYWHNQSIAIIGGADGPTSIFLAGKTGNPLPLYLIAGLLTLIIIVLFYLFRNKK